MSNIDQNKVYQVHEDVVSRNNQDGTFVLMKMDDSELFYKIDGVAAEVWKGIEKKMNLTAIKQQIMADYNVAASKLDADVETFVSSLLSKKLLK